VRRGPKGGVAFIASAGHVFRFAILYEGISPAHPLMRISRIMLPHLNEGITRDRRLQAVSNRGGPAPTIAAPDPLLVLRP